MINKISGWAQGIIIAVIIGTVLQMILPESKNKKYIQTIIGIYILFCIINPVIGSSISLDKYSLNQYININETKEKNNESYDENVKKIFESKVKTSIKEEINSFGYDSDSISIVCDEKYNINSIVISNIKEYKNDNQLINKVEISIKDKPAVGIPNSDKEKIIKCLSEKYDADTQFISIN